MKAYIYEDKKKLLWLVVNDELLGEPNLHTKDFEEEEGVAYPILADDIQAIKEACEEWLHHNAPKTQHYNAEKKDKA